LSADGRSWLGGPASHQALEPGDIGPPRDRDSRHVAAAVMQPEEIAGLGKQVEDLRGVIHERVGGVVATTDDPTVTAPVRVNTAADEVLRAALNNHALPRLECDVAEVLSPGAVLGKERRPTLEVGRHGDRVAMAPEPYSIAR